MITRIRVRIELIFIYICHVLGFLGLWILNSFKELIKGLLDLYDDMLDFIELLKKKGKW